MQHYFTDNYDEFLKKKKELGYNNIYFGGIYMSENYI